MSLKKACLIVKATNSRVGRLRLPTLIGWLLLNWKLKPILCISFPCEVGNPQTWCNTKIFCLQECNWSYCSLEDASAEQITARIQKVFSRGVKLFFLGGGEGGLMSGIQIQLKLGHHLPPPPPPPPPTPVKRHLSGVSLVCRWWPNIECWLGKLWFLRGSGPVLLWDPIFLWFFSGGPDPLSALWIRTWFL